MKERYDLVVIGSGSAGRQAALLGARQGLRTAIVERGNLGGTCFHQGSYAVRALQACARQFRDRLKSGSFGNKVDLLKVTLSDWMTAQRMVTLRLVDDFRAELERSSVDLIRGQGEFLDHNSLQVTEEHGTSSTIVADAFIVATGSRPEFQDSSRPRMVNSDQLLRIRALPERIVIIGAGYIGCEFASIYRTLGSEVTLIEKASQVLPGWAPEASTRVAEALELRGVNIVQNRHVAFEDIRENETSIFFGEESGQAVDADVVLVATGRKPNSKGLGLKALGIDDSTYLRVDARMRLANPGLYAVGDVIGLSLLDSTAFSQANTAINSILGHDSRYDPRWTPQCVHTEPPVASVGWSEDEALKNGIIFKAVSANLRLASDDERSVVDPEPTFVKVLVNPNSRILLGCLIVGDHAAVLANVAAMAIHLETPIDRLLDIPLAQPSAADALMATLRQLS
jgi:dihydrolipoamide dehydrogenase